MNPASAKQIEDSFLSFFEKGQRVIGIETEADYQFALELLEQLMTKAEDRDGEPLLLLIDIVANAVESYENSLESIQCFNRDVDVIDPGVSILRVLFDQYGLTCSDLSEATASAKRALEQGLADAEFALSEIRRNRRAGKEDV